jgi:hypothetical protein
MKAKLTLAAKQISKKGVIRVDHRLIECQYYTAFNGNVILAAVRDAGANPQSYEPMIGNPIRRSFNMRGWAEVTPTVFSSLLVSQN